MRVMKSLALGIVILLIVPSIGFEFKKPTLEILENFESKYETVEKVLTDGQVLMIADYYNYNFRVDDEELVKIIQLWMLHVVTDEQLSMVLQYWLNGSSFITKINASEIERELDCDHILLDSEYYLANVFATGYLVEKEVEENWSDWYEIPFYDCDDFTWRAMGIIHNKKILGGTATFYALVWFEEDGEIYGHALMLLRCLDGKWYYYDPITDRIFEKDQIPFNLVFVIG